MPGQVQGFGCHLHGPVEGSAFFCEAFSFFLRGARWIASQRFHDDFWTVPLPTCEYLLLARKAHLHRAHIGAFGSDEKPVFPMPGCFQLGPNPSPLRRLRGPSLHPGPAPSNSVPQVQPAKEPPKSFPQ